MADDNHMYFSSQRTFASAAEDTVVAGLEVKVERRWLHLVRLLHFRRFRELAEDAGDLVHVGWCGGNNWPADTLIRVAEWFVPTVKM